MEIRVAEEQRKQAAGGGKRDHRSEMLSHFRRAARRPARTAAPAEAGRS
jgi:hypothetical protein